MVDISRKVSLNWAKRKCRFLSNSVKLPTHGTLGKQVINRLLHERRLIRISRIWTVVFQLKGMCFYLTHLSVGRACWLAGWPCVRLCKQAKSALGYTKSRVLYFRLGQLHSASFFFLLLWPFSIVYARWCI